MGEAVFISLIKSQAVFATAIFAFVLCSVIAPAAHGQLFRYDNDVLEKGPYRPGVFLDGFDVVQFFKLQRNESGVKGQPDISASLTMTGYNYTFRFANEQNKADFVADPWKYLPKFGGFCSWGMANEWRPKWPWAKHIMGPPAGPEDAWTIYNGSLYMNLKPTVRDQWLEDADKHIAAAEDRWMSYYGSLQEGPLNTSCMRDRWLHCTLPAVLKWD